jgi:hypothetical protein
MSVLDRINQLKKEKYSKEDISKKLTPKFDET